MWRLINRCWVKSQPPVCLRLNRYLSMRRQVGGVPILSAVCLWRVVGLKCESNIRIFTFAAYPARLLSIKGCVFRAIYRNSIWIWQIFVWKAGFVYSTNAFQPIPYRAGNWRSRFVSWRITVKSIRFPATALGRGRGRINIIPR